MHDVAIESLAFEVVGPFKEGGVADMVLERALAHKRQRFAHKRQQFASGGIAPALPHLRQAVVLRHRVLLLQEVLHGLFANGQTRPIGQAARSARARPGVVVQITAIARQLRQASAQTSGCHAAIPTRWYHMSALTCGPPRLSSLSSQWVP